MGGDVLTLVSWVDHSCESETNLSLYLDAGQMEWRKLLILEGNG